jgi:hypothetical protein
MYVMAEFLERGWNVGAPEVDVGDDVFVVRDSDGDLSRIQVKTSRASQHQYGYSGQFRINTNQLMTRREPPLDYIFTIRLDDGWGPFIVLEQHQLQDYVANKDMGSKSGSSRTYRMRYEVENNNVETINCSGVDLTEHVDKFASWPRIDHPVRKAPSTFASGGTHSNRDG